jgi:hypothetical protein
MDPPRLAHKLKRMRWLAGEDQILKKAVVNSKRGVRSLFFQVQKYGKDNWERVAQELPNRLDVCA